MATPQTPTIFNLFLKWLKVGFADPRFKPQSDKLNILETENLKAASSEKENASSELTRSPQTLNLLLILNLNIVRPLRDKAGGDVAWLLDVLRNRQ